MDVIELEIFYDYLCPFVYRVAEMLDAVGKSSERQVHVGWRYFSLSQVNAKQESWTVWEAPESELVKGRLAFKAAEAARRQQAFDGFHMALLRARHRDGMNIDDPRVVEQVAGASGLDLARFRSDVEDPGILEALKHDHLEARGQYGVFGTPTFLFKDGAAAYVRLAQPPLNGVAVRVFDEIVSIGAREPAILEIKRPIRPTPD